MFGTEGKVVVEKEFKERVSSFFAPWEKSM